MTNLDQLIALRGLMRDIAQDGHTTTGKVTVDQRVISLLDALVDDGLGIKKENNIISPSGLKTGDIVGVSFDGPSLNYYENFATFLKHFPAKEPTKRFYVHDLKFTSGDIKVPEHFKRYRQAIRLWALLSNLADHSDGRRLFLLSSDKLEIECGFSVTDLTELDKLPQLEADFGESAASREEKRMLFKRALLEDLGKCTPTQRFGVLLRNFVMVYDRYWQNFRLYLEGISFDKIFEGYVEKHSKLITELNSVLSGVQTALIGLPIASFVILEKMAVAQNPTFKNTLLGIGCFAFVAFLWLLSLSQGRTLHGSEALAKELEEEIKRKSPDLAKKLEPSIARLACHTTWIKRLLLTVRILLVGLFFATTTTYAYVSFPKIREKIDLVLQSF
jgi:hypothetical protein